MVAKEIIKRILGDNGVTCLKGFRGLYKFCVSIVLESESYKICDSTWEIWKYYRDPEKHVFFGYYDIQQFDKSKEKILLTKIPIGANTKSDKAELVWVDVKNDIEHNIGTTSAWCWQQGARLRWHPLKKNVVMFNDVSNSHYITRVWDINEGIQIDEYPQALYDVTPDMRWGFSLNYSRLQRLRPGYGYNILPDETIHNKAPQNDGLFSVNLQTGETYLMISLHGLSEQLPESIGYWNYINHISVSPNGKRLIFFHIWTASPDARWMVGLYCINVDGSGLNCLEHEYRTSHYCWMDDEHIITTAGGFANKESRYIIYDITTGERSVLNGEMFKNDGHPTLQFDKNWFVTDTYPLKNSRQKLYVANKETGEYRMILDIFSDPRMIGEKRCDLHPRLTPDGKYISIDTTYSSGKRSVLILKNKEI